MPAAGDFSDYLYDGDMIRDIDPSQFIYLNELDVLNDIFDAPESSGVPDAGLQAAASAASATMPNTDTSPVIASASLELIPPLGGGGEDGVAVAGSMPFSPVLLGGLEASGSAPPAPAAPTNLNNSSSKEGPSKEEWEKQKPLIHLLYIEYALTLPSIMKIMETIGLLEGYALVHFLSLSFFSRSSRSSLRSLSHLRLIAFYNSLHLSLPHTY